MESSLVRVDRGADYGMLRSRTIYAARPVSFSRNSLANQKRHATTITRGLLEFGCRRMILMEIF